MDQTLWFDPPMRGERSDMHSGRGGTGLRFGLNTGLLLQAYAAAEEP